MDWDTEERRAAEVEGALLRQDLVRVVDPSAEEETSAWTACDLASMVEGCFHVRIDPWTLAPEERQRWLDRLADSYEIPDPGLDRAFLRYLWLLDGGERVGTLALPVSSLGRIDLPLWSLFVDPRRRGRGVASRVLRAAHSAARDARLRGILLDTHWAWQSSVRFYLGQRMWVVGWKRAIGFSWIDTLPRYEIVEAPERVVLSVTEQGSARAWITATREGRRLVLEEDEVLSARHGGAHAHATLAVALATRGWPLVRSHARWKERHHSMDFGEVEGLASKIEVFESIADHFRWERRTPRIPMLFF